MAPRETRKCPIAVVSSSSWIASSAELAREVAAQVHEVVELVGLDRQPLMRAPQLLREERVLAQRRPERALAVRARVGGGRAVPRRGRFGAGRFRAGRFLGMQEG